MAPLGSLQSMSIKDRTVKTGVGDWKVERMGKKPTVDKIAEMKAKITLGH